MMKCAIGCAAFLSVASGCQNYVYRDANVYEAEVKFFERASAETAVTLNGLVSRFCVCTNNQWSDPVCADADVKSAILEQRVPYHTGMMLYLADLAEKKPAEPSDDLNLQCGGDE